MEMVVIRSDGAETDVLTQWDTGTRLRMSGIDTASVVVLRYRVDDGTAYEEVDPVEIDREYGILTYAIEDEALQKCGTLYAALYQSLSGKSSTTYKQAFVIEAADKPEGYVYTPRERKNYYTLAARVAALEAFSSQAAVDDALARVNALAEKVSADAALTAGIREELTEKLAQLQVILNDVENLETQTSRAVAAARLANDAADRLQLMYDTCRKDAETAASAAKTAQSAASEAGMYASECAGFNQAIRDYYQTVSAEMQRIQEECAESAEDAEGHANTAAVASRNAQAVLDSLKVAGTFCVKNECKYDANGEKTAVTFADYGLSFDVAPKIILNNPFSAFDSAACALDVTKVGFTIYLAHAAASGATSVTFFVGE